MKDIDVKVGDRIYCDNFEHFGVVTKISEDSVDKIIDYVDDGGNPHKVYRYMIKKANEKEDE